MSIPDCNISIFSFDLLAELVHFFLTTRFLYVFTFSLGGSTEPPEPPLDPPQGRVRTLCL